MSQVQARSASRSLLIACSTKIQGGNSGLVYQSQEVPWNSREVHSREVNLPQPYRKREMMKVMKKEILCDESCGKKKPCATKTARKNGSQLLISKSCFFQANPGFEENCKDREIICECHLSSDTSPRARQSLPTSLRSCPARPRDLFSFEKKHT